MSAPPDIFPSTVLATDMGAALFNVHTPGFPPFIEGLPTETARQERYELRFAHTVAELEDIQRLRFEVFNLELNEGLDTSYMTGRDEDEFDPVCHHLVIYDLTTDKPVGTYRLQTYPMAKTGKGFYSATEFDFSTMPETIKEGAVEIGRACIAKEHRSLQVLYLLWQGLGMYLSHNRKRYLFGCCSLTSQDPIEGKQVMDFLVRKGHIHPEVHVDPLPALLCYPGGFEAEEVKRPKVPRLMRVYLSFGAKICGPPAIDRQFKTIDYLAFFDAETLNPRAGAYFKYRS